MKLVLSLDLPSKEENLKLCKRLKDYDIWLKVGFRSFIRDGKEFLEELKSINPNFNIFLDLKLYDIPNTMLTSALEITKLPVEMFNIHASSGRVAMQKVMQELNMLKKRPLVLSVTALTSFDEENFSEIYNSSIDTAAQKFAKMSYESGVDGVVCSVHESKAIKEITNKNFITLTPGIRLTNSNNDDQKRIASPKDAKENLVDFIVVGRPIYNDSNPQAVVEEILKEI